MEIMLWKNFQIKMKENALTNERMCDILTSRFPRNPLNQRSSLHILFFHLLVNHFLIIL